MNQINQSITYEEVFGDVDVEYITTSNGIKENIILKQKQALNEFVNLANSNSNSTIQLIHYSFNVSY